MNEKVENTDKNFDPEQVVGDQNSVSGEVKVDNDPTIDTRNETSDRRTRNILKEAEDTRERLNRKKNEVRDYGADTRETLL